MASGKERARWERWYDAVSERVENQKRAITRLTLALTETTAALVECAEADPPLTESQARSRAKEALDRLEAIRNGSPGSRGESEATEEPLPDPRRNHGA